MKTTRLSTLVISTVAATVLASSCAFAAMDDVIVWNSTRTKAQVEDTLVNGYTSTTGMAFWWNFNNSSDLVYDAISGASKGVIKGTPNSLATNTPNDTSNLAASGFTSVNNWLVANVGRGGNWQMATSDTTYEMWIRNPQFSSTKAVFWSLTANEAGNNDMSDKRLWVNADGSLSMGENGTATGHRNITSAPLVWEADKWYQITVSIDGYDGRPANNIFSETVKVYRGAEGGTSVETPLDYLTSWPQYPGTGYPWMSVGGHTQEYYWETSGSPGYLGADTTPVPEPGSLLALASGILGLGGFVARKRKS